MLTPLGRKVSQKRYTNAAVQKLILFQTYQPVGVIEKAGGSLAQPVGPMTLLPSLCTAALGLIFALGVQLIVTKQTYTFLSVM